MDPIADMLNMVKNAGLAHKESVLVRYSNLKKAVAECLLRHNYISGISKKTKKGIPMLELTVLYKDEDPRIHEVKRISKPSRRMYSGFRSVPSVKNGLGLTVFSTPKGILSHKEAKKELVGGEILFTIW